MNVLSKEEVSAYLEQHLKNWDFNGKSIQREFTFKDFGEAFSFMTAIALKAEKLDHHPDWSNVYNVVSIKLSTHKPEGITQKDMEMASYIDAISNRNE